MGVCVVEANGEEGEDEEDTHNGCSRVLHNRDAVIFDFFEPNDTQAAGTDTHNGPSRRHFDERTQINLAPASRTSANNKLFETSCSLVSGQRSVAL